MIELSGSTVTLQSGETRLVWTKEADQWILRVDARSCDETWITLLVEDRNSGYRAYLEGPISWRERKYCVPSWVLPEIENEKTLRWGWTQIIGGNELQTDARFSGVGDNGVDFIVSWRLGRDTVRPHFGYSLITPGETPIDDYAWIQSPSQTGITDPKSNSTVWFASTYDRTKGISKFDGCQAMFAKKDSLGNLLISLKLPPAYTDFDSVNELKKGTPVTIRGALIASSDVYYRSFPLVLNRQPLEPQPARFSYRKHLDLVIETLKDPRKWKSEGEGIIYYCVVQGDPFYHSYRMARDREGPGWGGSWDLEMIYMFHQYRNMFADRDTAAFIENHCDRMLRGWIENPKFRMGPDLTWREPGDMRDSFVAALMLDGPTRPEDEADVIWTCHNAYTIYYLSKLSALTGQEKYRNHALAVAEWFFRVRNEDGTVPTLWMLENYKAVMTHNFQPGSCVYMISALLELYNSTYEDRYRQAAIELADSAYRVLTPAIPHWGQGELDWIPKQANAIDPTGVSYIIWGFADAFELTGDARYLEMVDKFAGILLCLFALWEPHEELLRGMGKITVGSHGMDLKMAGGVACGTWDYYSEVLMNRNEIGDALLRAYEVTGKERYREFLIAYMHWHMYFQFTNEVPEEPVSTLGSCPQNHFWTRSYPCYNNDWGCTASKNASLMMKLLERGIIKEKQSQSIL